MTASSQTLKLEGTFDRDNLVSIRDRLLDALSEGFNLDIDLSAVTRIDSAALAGLVEALNEARKRGLRLTLAATSETVEKMLRLTRLDRLFPA